MSSFDREDTEKKGPNRKQRRAHEAFQRKHGDNLRQIDASAKRRARIEAIVVMMARATTPETPETIKTAIAVLDGRFGTGAGENARRAAVLVAQGKPAREALDKHPARPDEPWTDALAKLVDAFIAARGGKIR